MSATYYPKRGPVLAWRRVPQIRALRSTCGRFTIEYRPGRGWFLWDGTDQIGAPFILFVRAKAYAETLLNEQEKEG